MFYKRFGYQKKDLTEVQITEMVVFWLPEQLDRQIRQFWTPHMLLYRCGMYNRFKRACGRRAFEQYHFLDLFLWVHRV